DLSYSSDWHYLSLIYHGGFKAFYHQKDENQIVTKLAGQYRHKKSADLFLGVRSIFQDTILHLHDRDFRLVIGEAFIHKKFSNWLNLQFYLGGNYYKFKPDDNENRRLKFSYVAPSAGMSLYLKGGLGVAATLYYTIDFRFYGHWAQMLSGTGISDTTKERFDIRHTGGIRVKQRIRYLKDFNLIIEVSYILSVNDTNSYGSGAHWHRLRLVVSAQLPFNFTLHLMGTLQFTDYDDIYVEGDLYEPDADENENSFVLKLSYPIWQDLSVFVHGAIYRDDFHSTQLDIKRFKRETVMLGLTYDISF
ncbi:MAG: hypothetical protein JRJ19_11380, partial [Deltaproteobacteria bacterium]|nr:hypothetical protein [Deltaproteobacteria bacterium]